MEFNYLAEKVRMLNSLGRMSGECVGTDCSICPLSCQNNGLNIPCGAFEMNHPLEATEVVRKWTEEHPRKTRKDILLEKFSNAELGEDGVPLSCAEPLGWTYVCGRGGCKICWNVEAEE